VPHARARRREFPTLPSERGLMDSLDGSEQGWEVNSRAGCRSHPTVPTARRLRLRNQRFLENPGRGKRPGARLTPGPWNRHLPYSKKGWELEQDAVHLVGYLLLHGGDDVGVDVQGHLDAGVAQAFGHDFRVHARLQQDCGMAVSQTIEMKSRI
jgi:hypothetical protein